MAHACKITSLHKAAIHPNIDDTDTEDDTNESSTCPAANAWMEEWKSYINAAEDVPDGMSLVYWCGICLMIILFYNSHLCH
jgi:hypothetical protein